MADDKYYRITRDEALFNAYIAYANTNNPDDRAKIENLYDSFKKGKISTSEFNVAVMQAAKAQGKTDVAKQGGTPTTDGAHTERVAANPGNGIDAQGKSEIPNSSAVSDANAAKTQVEENPQPQAPTDVTADVMKAVKADGNTSFANWRQSLVNQGWNGDPSKIMYDPSTGKFMYNVNGQAVKSAGKPRRVRQGRSSGNTYATAGIPKGGVVSPATMMRTSGVPPVQAGYGMNVPIGEEEPDYTLTYDAKTSSMKPNDPYSYYDPSRNPPNEYIYDPITHELVRR